MCLKSETKFGATDCFSGFYRKTPPYLRRSVHDNVSILWLGRSVHRRSVLRRSVLYNTPRILFTGSRIVIVGLEYTKPNYTDNTRRKVIEAVCNQLICHFNRFMIFSFVNKGLHRQIFYTSWYFCITPIMNIAPKAYN